MPDDALSPLSEAAPTSFEELFSRDPLSLSDQDFLTIATKLRADRVLWNQAENKPKKTPKAKGTVELDLGDIGL